MARREDDLKRRVKAVEEDLRRIHEALPPPVRFQLMLDKMRSRTRNVSERTIARAAATAVREVRREARRRQA